jgi:hypothetical protein
MWRGNRRFAEWLAIFPARDVERAIRLYGSNTMKFEDITIAGVSDDTGYLPNGEFDVYIDLSSEPPENWIKIFAREIQNRTYVGKMADLLSGQLHIQCEESDIDNAFVRELRTILCEVNEKYKLYLERESAREELKEGDTDFMGTEAIKRKQLLARLRDRFGLS